MYEPAVYEIALDPYKHMWDGNMTSLSGPYFLNSIVNPIYPWECGSLCVQSDGDLTTPILPEVQFDKINF